MNLRLRNYHIALATSLIALAGVGAGWWGYSSQGLKIMNDLMLDAVHCAVGFDPTELVRLSGSRDDLKSEDYARVKARLRRFHQTDPSIKFIYIFRYLPTQKKVVFLADSADPGTSDESLPGDEYPEAPNSPGLQLIIRTGQATTEGPLQDSFGSWVTGYALPGPLPPAGKPCDIVGVDMAASDWNRQLWTMAGAIALAVWVVLGLPFATLIVLSREREQREAIRNLSEAMEQSQSAVMIVDLDSCIEYVNASLSRQLGYARKELVGHNWRDFQSPANPPELIADLVTTVRSGRSWQGELSNRRMDGTHYPARANVSPVKRRNGEITCVIAVFDDMTEVKRNETVLREAKERAEAGDRAKGQFLATMSHEVRTPLNGIIGFTSLLLETPLSPEQMEYAKTIRTSSETLIQLTGDILDYARIESGRLTLDPQPCNVRECMEDALDLVASKSSAQEIELLHWVDSSVPTVLTLDGGRLRQVLINLVGNALKFTTAGEIDVTASAERLTAGNWLLTFAVRDTGPGIAPDDQRKLFKPFSQLDDSSTRQHGGTGLGLAICRNIVELMGGHISLQSELGLGSTFIFTLLAEAGIEHAAPQATLPPVRLAVAALPGKLREELARIGKFYGAQVVETTPSELATTPGWSLAVVNVDSALATALAALPEPRAGLPAENIIGLVPLSLSSATRHALRPHFRLLVSKPIHHGMLGRLITGAPVAAKSVPKTESFTLRVLLVEDNSINQRLMQKVLSNLGCTTVLAKSGLAALTELTHARFDVVLMDLHMPEMDGLTAISEIRRGVAGPHAAATWIIALTADARREQRALTLEAGANDYLTKPLQLAELVASLKRCNALRGS